MTSPGIYLVNSTGEMTPLATEDGSGDRALLREALAEHTALDVDALDGTPERTWMENYDDEPEYVGVYAEPIKPTCEWFVGGEEQGFEECGAGATHTLVSRLGRTAELATCDEHGVPEHAGQSLFTRSDAAADDPEVMTDGGVDEIVPVCALEAPDTDDSEVIAFGMDLDCVRAWGLEDYIIDEDSPHWSDDLDALAPGERVALRADTYDEVVADGGVSVPQGPYAAPGWNVKEVIRGPKVIDEGDCCDRCDDEFALGWRPYIVFYENGIVEELCRRCKPDDEYVADDMGGGRDE